MVFIEAITTQKHEVKRSTFISSLVPINDFKTTLEKLKTKHHKATHIIWAYRQLNKHDQIVENSSDDGEPKGCAGAPTLSVLRGEKLINTALLTVRYFGGIKLGTGGMVRAYTAAAKEVVKISELKLYEKRSLFTFETIYTHVNRYEHYFNKANIVYPKREFNTHSVSWELYLTQKEVEKFKAFQLKLS